jgi:hypothetical protein
MVQRRHKYTYTNYKIDINIYTFVQQRHGDMNLILVLLIISSILNISFVLSVLLQFRVLLLTNMHNHIIQHVQST